MAGGAATTAAVSLSCPNPESFYLPGTVTLASAILSTTIWAFVAGADDDDTPPAASSLQFAPPQITVATSESDGRPNGANLVLMGSF